MFDAQIRFGFHKNYKVSTVEFRRPFEMPERKQLLFKGMDLFLPTLEDVKNALDEIDVSIQKIDVGLDAPSIGVSFFSDDYEKDLDVKLGGVTVRLGEVTPSTAKT